MPMNFGCQLRFFFTQQQKKRKLGTSGGRRNFQFVSDSKQSTSGDLRNTRSNATNGVREKRLSSGNPKTAPSSTTSSSASSTSSVKTASLTKTARSSDKKKKKKPTNSTNGSTNRNTSSNGRNNKSNNNSKSRTRNSGRGNQQQKNFKKKSTTRGAKQTGSLNVNVLTCPNGRERLKRKEAKDFLDLFKEQNGGTALCKSVDDSKTCYILCNKRCCSNKRFHIKLVDHHTVDDLSQRWKFRYKVLHFNR